eukprot:g34395.t1
MLLTKTLYDFQKTQEADFLAGSPLKELVVEQFDEEQIWQEIELQNNSVLDYFKDTVSFLQQASIIRLIETENVELDTPEEKFENDFTEDDEITEGNDGKQGELKKQEVKKKDSEKETEKLSDEDSEVNIDIDEVEKKTKIQGKSSRFTASSELDDKFFRLSEMENFLEKFEKDDKQKNDDEINYFEDIPSEDEELVPKLKTKRKSSRNLQYKDFFDPVEGEKPMVKDDDEENESVEAEEEPEPEGFEQEEEMD